MKFTTLLGAASAIAMATAATAQDTDLLVFDYSGFEEEQHHATYIAQHGAVPAFAFFGDEDEAFQKIRAGFQADVAHICAGSVTKWTDSGIIEPWDTSKITYFDDLDGNLKGNDIAGGMPMRWAIWRRALTTGPMQRTHSSRQHQTGCARRMAICAPIGQMPLNWRS